VLSNLYIYPVSLVSRNLIYVEYMWSRILLYLTFMYFKGKVKCNMKILGLKPVRFREWWAIVKLEGGTNGLLPLLKMLHKGFMLGVGRKTWRTRLRTCIKCPIYNANLRQCRPLWNDEMGCGCYVPFLAMTRGECWGKTNTENLGWK